MTARRGFLALVGSAVFSGIVLRDAGAAQRPTLILPSTPPATPSGWPLLQGYKNQMEAVLEIDQRLSEAMFNDWLEGGLQLANRRRRSVADAATEEERVIAAMRAGAI